MNQDAIKLDCDSIKEMMREDPEAAKAIVELMKEVEDLEPDCLESVK